MPFSLDVAQNSVLYSEKKNRGNNVRVMPKKNNRDKENISLLGRFGPHSARVQSSGIELVRLRDEPRLFWHKSNPTIRNVCDLRFFPRFSTPAHAILST